MTRRKLSWGVTTALVLVMMLVAVLRLLQVPGVSSYAVDHAFFTDRELFNPMTPTTAMNFIFMGLALLGLRFASLRKTLPPEILIILPVLLSIFTILGYSFDLIHLEKAFFNVIPALHTALAFVLLGLGILCTYYPEGFVDRLIYKSNNGTPPLRVMGQFFKESPISWCILFFSIILTVTAWQMTRAHARNNVRLNFEIRCQEINSIIKSRIQSCENLLDGARGLFYASDKVTPEEWSNYVASLQIKKELPELKGIGYIDFVPQKKLDQFLRAAAAENKVFSQLKRDASTQDYLLVRHFDPPDENNTMLVGLDFGGYPERRAAMHQARDKNGFSLSRIIPLAGEKDSVLGFNIYLPVFSSLEETLRPENGQPRELAGYVFGVFRLRDLIEQIQGAIDPNIRFEIFDTGKPLSGQPDYDTHAAPAASPAPLAISGIIPQHQDIPAESARSGVAGALHLLARF